jgi:hypothetical protein
VAAISADTRRATKAELEEIHKASCCFFKPLISPWQAASCAHAWLAAFCTSLLAVLVAI